MPRSPHTVAIAATIATVLAAAAPAASQQSTGPLAALAFMSGCWRGDAGVDRSIEENWTAADTDVMLATTRYQDDNAPRTVGWEFSRIVADSAGIALIPAPAGNPAGRFRLTTPQAAGEATFEDPAHDFPKRIVYRRVDARTLFVRVDGGEGSEDGMTFRMENVACPTPR
ncbi:MAG TPA: DUF6265 family protein [Longimicrobiaceae bacterium]|nr:DUF6265 family protein [Longimicrobiaceae bacterium]